MSEPEKKLSFLLFFSSKSQIYLLSDSIVNIVVILATKNIKKRQESTIAPHSLMIISNPFKKLLRPSSPLAADWWFKRLLMALWPQPGAHHSCPNLLVTGLPFPGEARRFPETFRRLVTDTQSFSAIYTGGLSKWRKRTTSNLQL